MEQKYDNQFTMFSTVRDFMAGHTAETSGVAAIGAAVGALSAVIAQIDAAATAQGSPLRGIARDKAKLRLALEEAVFLVSESLAVLALAGKNFTLLAEVEMQWSILQRLSAENLDAFATRVVARAGVHQSALTGTYGVSLAQVGAITTARAAFAPWVHKPRTAVAERAAQTSLIPGLVQQGRAVLKKQLDRLMNRYRVTNVALFAGYQAARVIVDRRGPGGTTAEER